MTTMLLLLALTCLGAYIGWTRAARAGGDRLDRLQYAAGHAIFFALATFVVTLALTKLALT